MPSARTLRDPAKAGLYHLVAGGETTWHGYARFVLEQAQAAGVELKAAPEAVDAGADQRLSRRPPARRTIRG